MTIMSMGVSAEFVLAGLRVDDQTPLRQSSMELIRENATV